MPKKFYPDGTNLCVVNDSIFLIDKAALYYFDINQK